MERTPELLNISYCEDSNNLPVLNINNDLDILIISKGFLGSIINNTLLKAYWRFNNIHTGKLSFSVDTNYTHHTEPREVKLSLFLNHEFVGYTTVYDLNEVAVKAMAHLKKIKIEVEGREI